ncbi:MAG: dihydroorotate dehydrogenase electron transfer subunit [Candidatus Cloacimonadales bacterium]|nr:dihydroorotate dehydrogenase electron transfer subunit [Candidatus Cloacimonadales bacterium]
MNKRATIKISNIIKEAKDIKTFVFKHNLGAKPGQFIMLTDFEGGEKPFSLADCDTNTFTVTVKRIGEFTSRLFQKEIGDFLSVRGPFGSSFFISKGSVLLVGGGYGTPPLYFLAKELLKNGASVTVVNGAKSKDDLVFCDRFRELGVHYSNITQLGCLGREGTSVDLAQSALAKTKFDYVYAAGPEMMLKALQPILKEHEYEFLFERYMKCAIGICGNCTIDPLGIRLCVEGPVLPKKLVEQLTEFGKYHRDATGKRIEY